MNDEITNIPKIRFKGYTEDWEERKLKDIFDIHTDFVSNGSFQALKDNVKLYKTENYAYMIRLQDASNNWSGPWLYTDKQGFDFLSKSMVYKDDILMSDRGTIGKFFLVPQLDKPMTLSSNAVLLRSTKNDNNFIYYMLNTSNISNQIIVRTTPGVQPMISKTEFKKINTRIPNIQEQQKIGSFFKQLDNTIALHQRELDLLRKTKQTYLQKMFPKTGEDRPEQRKLGDESDVRDGTHDSPKYYDKGYPLVTSKNLKDFGLDLSNVSFISDEDFEVINKRSKVGIGDILFGMIGTIGNPVLVDRADFAIKNVALIKEQKKILNSFLIQILKSPVFDKYIKNENAGGTQKFLSLSKIRDFNFLCPNIEEQNCISAFFKQLDDTIALHQRNLNVLKEMKKSLLQQMFV